MTLRAGGGISSMAFPRSCGRVLRPFRSARQRSDLTSADSRSHTEFVDECARCHAGNRAELGNEVRLVVVTRDSGDARPARAGVLAQRLARDGSA